ncbi:MAG: glycerophosphodiester phosphodiesterase family protein [Alphaproteobacteria bacterium]|nr:glycerophosphodiester phosphodiesterase family protein [Alphaproteobacteria bacterium]
MPIRKASTKFALIFLGLASSWGHVQAADGEVVQLGVRPFFLVDRMDNSELKTTLQQCKAGPFSRSDFSIGHRGAPLQFPEHTKESYVAAALQGAGIVECDVTFTKDRELVCRHSQCDLHTTTNILAIPGLAAKCSEPFTPADPPNGIEASAKCCTSDITLTEFRMLKGKMDGANKMASTVDEYLDGTPSFRTDSYAGSATLLTHGESIELLKELGVKFTPELKSPDVDMPYEGDYTQEAYAQQLIDDYRAAGVAAEDVWAQSFNLDDVRYWIANEPAFGNQAVYLEGRYNDEAFDVANPETWSPTMEELVADGVKILAPPMWMLVTTNDAGNIIPSTYAKAAKDAGLDLITWTIERSGLLAGGGGWYYQTVTDAIDNDGDMYRLLDVVAQDVGILGIFSDWPATVTYYANCVGLE